MYSKTILLSIACALLLCVSTMVIGQDKRELIVISHRVHKQSATAEEAGAMGINLIDKFEQEHPNVKVIYETYPTPRIQEKFHRLGPLSDCKEDLIHIVGSWSVPRKMEAFLTPIDSYQETEPLAGFPDDYPKGLAEIGRVKGSTYTIPVRVCYGGVHWANTKIYEERGIEYNPDLTAQNLADIAQKCTYTRPSGEKVFGYVWRGTVGYLFESIERFTKWYGGKMITSDLQCVINEPSAVKGVKLLQKLYEEGVAPPNVHTFDYAEETKMFMESRVAIGNGNTSYGNTYNDPSKSKIAGYAVMVKRALPQELQEKGKGPYVGMTTSWSIGILKGSDNKDLAWEYLRLLCSKEGALSMGLSGTTPARMSVLNSPQYRQNNPAAAVEAQVAPYCERIFPAFEGSTEVQDLIGTYGQEILYRGAPVQETLDELAKEIKKFLP